MSLVHDIIAAYKDSKFTSYKQLSKASGVTHATVCRVFSKKTGRDNTLRKLAKTLGVNADRTTHGELIDEYHQAEDLGNQYEVVVGKFMVCVGIMSGDGKFLIRSTMGKSDPKWKEIAIKKADKFNSQIGKW